MKIIFIYIFLFLCIIGQSQFINYNRECFGYIYKENAIIAKAYEYNLAENSSLNEINCGTEHTINFVISFNDVTSISQFVLSYTNNDNAIWFINNQTLRYRANGTYIDLTFSYQLIIDKWYRIVIYRSANYVTAEIYDYITSSLIQKRSNTFSKPSYSLPINRIGGIPSYYLDAKIMDIRIWLDSISYNDIINNDTANLEAWWICGDNNTITGYDSYKNHNLTHNGFSSANFINGYGNSLYNSFGYNYNSGYYIPPDVSSGIPAINDVLGNPILITPFLYKMYDFYSCNNLIPDTFLQQLQIIYNDTITNYLLDSITVAPDAGLGGSYANTGLAYNIDSNYYVYAVGNTNLSSYNKVFFLDRLFNKVDSFDVNSWFESIQGLTYDPDSQYYYAWGIRDGFSGSISDCDITYPYYSDAFRLFKFNKDFSIALDTILCPCNFQAGMLAYDSWENYVWLQSGSRIIPYNTITNYMDTIDGEFNIRLKNGAGTVSWGAEGFSVNYIDSTFFIATGDTLRHNERYSSFIENFEQINQNSQAEGLIVDPVDMTLLYNCDEYAHGTIPNGNKLYHVNPFNTYHNVLYFPQSIPWEYGYDSLNCNYTRGKEIRVIKLDYDTDSAIWISPVINFSNYDKVLNINNYYVNLSKVRFDMKFRGANISPEHPKLKVSHLEFYDANLSGKGWGSTVPSIWQNTPTDFKYIQFLIKLKNK